MELANIRRLMASSDPQERRCAALGLAELDPALAAEPLAQLLRDANQAVSEAAQISLSLLGGRPTIEALVPLLAAREAAVRNAAIEVLRKVGQDDLDLLHELTRNPDEHVRIFCVDILGAIASPDSVDVLCECLQDANPNVRNAALIALGRIGDAMALPAMLPLMDDQEWIRFTLIEALSHIGGEAAVSFLAGQIGRWTTDEMTLGAIIDGLGQIGDGAGLASLLELLPKAQGFVGVNLVRSIAAIVGQAGLVDLTAAARAELKRIVEESLVGDEQPIDLLEILAVIGDRQSAAVLMDLAQTLDPQADDDRLAALRQTMVALELRETAAAMLHLDEHLVELGAEVLYQTGGQEEALVAALGRVQGPARRSLAKALSRSEAPSAKACLRSLSSDDDGHVAAIAIRAAARWAVDENDMAGLGAYLRHAYPDVRTAALEAICGLIPEQAERVLLAQFEDGDALIRQLALEGLARINSARLPQLLVAALPTQPLDVFRLARDFNVALDVELIAGVLASADAGLKQTILDLIGRQRLAELRPQVQQALDDPNKRSAYQAILALGRFKDADARQVLLQKLHQGPDLLKVAVLKAFADWQDPALAEDLEFCLEDDNPDVVHACRRVMEKLERSLNAVQHPEEA